MSEANEMGVCPKCGKSIKRIATRCVWCFEKVEPLRDVVSNAPASSLSARRACPRAGRAGARLLVVSGLTATTRVKPAAPRSRALRWRPRVLRTGDACEGLV